MENDSDNVFIHKKLSYSEIKVFGHNYNYAYYIIRQDIGVLFTNNRKILNHAKIGNINISNINKVFRYES